MGIEMMKAFEDHRCSGLRERVQIDESSDLLTKSAIQNMPVSALASGLGKNFCKQESLISKIQFSNAEEAVVTRSVALCASWLCCSATFY